jgi:predicted HTH domain antitoxin
MKLAIELDLPDGAIDKSAVAELVRSVKEQAVLNLCAQQRISAGEAAEMLGCTRFDLLDLLRRSGIGFLVDLDQDDLDQIRQLRESHGPSAP